MTDNLPATPEEVREEMITAALILLFGILIGVTLRSLPARRAAQSRREGPSCPA